MRNAQVAGPDMELRQPPAGEMRSLRPQFPFGGIACSDKVQVLAAEAGEGSAAPGILRSQATKAALIGDRGQIAG